MDIVELYLHILTLHSLFNLLHLCITCTLVIRSMELELGIFSLSKSWNRNLQHLAVKVVVCLSWWKVDQPPMSIYFFISHMGTWWNQNAKFWFVKAANKCWILQATKGDLNSWNCPMSLSWPGGWPCTNEFQYQEHPHQKVTLSTR